MPNLSHLSIHDLSLSHSLKSFFCQLRYPFALFVAGFSMNLIFFSSDKMLFRQRAGSVLVVVFFCGVAKLL